MALTDEVIRGNTAEWSQTFTSQNLALLLGYVGHLQHKTSKNIIAKYSKNAKTGYISDKITETDAGNGVFSIYIDEDITDDEEFGPYEWEFKASTTNANFDSSRTGDGLILDAFTLVDSTTENLGSLA